MPWRRPPGGGAEGLLLGRVGTPSWKKGFPGAEGGKAHRSWPGEEGLAEYSRKGGNLGERERRGVAELIFDKLSQEFWGLKEGSFLFFQMSFSLEFQGCFPHPPR